jgi:trigger factor
MQVSLENTGNLGRKLTVQVPSKDIDDKVNSRIRDLGNQVRLKGFRPGKVPFNVLEKRYGKQVRQEVVGELIQQSFQDAVSKENLRPVAMPEIATEPPRPNQDLEFTASFEVYPELQEFDVSGLEIERVTADVTDADVEAMIETLREQRRSWNDCERAAEDGDLVFFHFSVESKDGRFPADDQERAGAILGRGAFDAKFEKALIGVKAGDEKSFKVSFDKDFREPGLAGKKGTASVTVEKVQESELPEVDEAFAATFGVTEGGMDAFRDDVRRNMERELHNNLSRKLRGVVLESLIDGFPDLDVPQAMVEAEAGNMQGEAVQKFEAMGIKDQEPPAIDNFLEQAQRRVRAALLVSEVARHGELQVDQGRVRDMVTDIASTYENPQSIVNLYYGDERLMANVQNVVMEEQAVEWIVERAKVIDAPQAFEEVMRPEQG